MSPSTARSERASALAGAGRIAAGVAGVALYALLSHWLMVHAANRPWAVAVLFGPLVAAVAAGAWARRQPLVLAACGAAVAGIVLTMFEGGVEDMNRLYVLQHGGIHLALAWLFGSTLRPGGTPLITTLAETLHERMAPGQHAYTRWLTQLWAVYFVAMVLLSLVIYRLAPWPWWSLFGNVLTPLAAATLFVAEHAVRYRRHPEFERVTLRSAMQAYRRHSAAMASR